jgi:hypothetical protein
MSDDTRYNGWTNYETWVVKLWIDNDQGSYEDWQERAQAVWEAAADADRYSWQTREEWALAALADALKEYWDNDADQRMEEMGGKLPPACVYSDLLNAALSEVNWREIADAMLEDVDKSEDDEAGEVVQ